MQFTYVSPSVERWRGRETQELLETQKSMEEMYPSETLIPFYDRLSKLDNNVCKNSAEKSNHSDLTMFTHKEYTKDGSIMWVEVTWRVIRDEKGTAIKLVGVSRDVTSRKKAEDNLKKAHEELEERVKERTRELNEANISLRVLLKKMGDEKKEIEKNILVNFRDLVSPILAKLKRSKIGKHYREDFEILEYNLNNIVSPFIKNLSSMTIKFTPMENQVANLIRKNKSTKEIADSLNVSINAIEFHRHNMRKKLGITSKRVNLRTYLQTLSQED